MSKSDALLPSLLEPAAVRRGPIATIAPNAPIDRVYSYVVPEALADRCVPGVRVRVPFGSKARLVEGWVVERSEGDWDATLRPVAEVLDDAPLVTPSLLALAKWIARYYACPPGPALKAVAPSATRGKSAFRVVRYVTLRAARRDDDNLRSEPGCSQAGCAGETNPGVSERQGATAKSKRSSKKQQGVLDALARAARPVAIGELCSIAGCTPGLIKTMAASELINIEERRELKTPALQPVPAAGEGAREPDFELNPEQYAAAERMIAAMESGEFRVLVLFGVTGSGKTEVYIRGMRHSIAAGRQAIVLVPEIALTTQTVQRLSRRFERVAVVHSRLSETQRARTWAAAAAGEIDVIIGTRSAVFAPCRRLGVIIVDEEQEASFKHMAAPRYHTRDVAIMRGQIERIPVVLGSATPALETWHNVGRLAHYELLRLPNRVAGLEPPRLHLVDMRAEHKTRRGVHLLSREMERYLVATLERREQAVLLLNRRGYANYLFCPKCDTPIVCPNCGVFMVFHQATDLAHCHYCQARMVVPRRCAMSGCGGPLVRFGMGTERVEEELRVKFPKARVARMDSDIMQKPADYADVLRRFEQREIDVLVGTQMIAKGLDYPFVSFVGVVSADTALAIDDFRSTERTFQLVLQVAGRSGRGTTGGDVVVQTFNADLPTIRHALHQDYERFAEEELHIRRQTRLPPITRLVRIVLSDPRLTRARDAAALLVRTLREKMFAAKLPGVVFDARACSIPRLRNEYRFETLLSFDSAGAMLTALDRLRAEGALKGAVRTMIVDVDPVALQ